MLAMVAGLLVALTAASAFAQEVTIQLKWHHQFQFAGYYAAQEQGYFEEAGLEVTLIEGGSGVDVFEAVKSGAADFGILGAELLERRLNGEPVVAVATFYQYSPYVLVGLESSGIAEIRDIAGKRISATSGILPPEILGMLSKAGLDAGAYTVLSTEKPMEALLYGEVDLITAYSTDQPFQVMERGQVPVVFEPQETGIDFYGDTLFCLEETAYRQADTVLRVRDAVIAGWRHALDHPEQVLAAILERESSRTAALSRAALEFELAHSRRLLLPGLVDLGHMSQSRWHKMADMLVVLGRAPEGFALNGFLFEAQGPSSFMYQLILVALLLAGVTVLAMFLILLWNRQLRRLANERTEELRAKTQALEQEIQERGEVESRLRRLVDILEATTDFVGMCDVHGRGAYVNLTGRKMLGYASKADLSQNSFLDIYPDREHERFQDEIVPQLLERGVWHGEMTLQDRSGREIATSQVILGHRDDTGKVRYFSTIARDITNQKRQDKALRESRRTLLTLISNLPGMAYRCQNDRDWTMEFISEGCIELTGYQPDDLIGNKVRSFNSLVDEKDQNPIWQTVQDALKRRVPFQLQYRIRTRNGDQKWILEHGRGVFTKRGHFVAIEGFMLDITQRRQAEEAMTRLRLYLKSVIDSMPSILVAVDPEGRVTHWNLEAEEKTGISASEAQGALVTDVLPILKSQMARIRDAIRKRRPAKAEQRRVDFNGHRLNLEFMVYPLMAKGIEGAVIRVDDITQRVRLEEILAQTEKMMLVGGLAAGMAHEINNPLGGILQAVNNIQRRTAKELEDNQHVAEQVGLELDALHHYFKERKIDSFLSNIAEACDRAARIVSEMLAFSRAGETTFVVTEVEDLINTAVRWAHNDIDMKRGHGGEPIQLMSDCHPNTGSIQCDPAKIQQVLLNLIRNAAQALQASDDVPHPMITIRSVAKEDRVRIEVLDNGPGLSEESCKRAFEPFYTTKEVGVGTGLGLSVSYFLIVDQHRGSIEVQSELGQGARFIIELPRVQQGVEVLAMDGAQH